MKTLATACAVSCLAACGGAPGRLEPPDTESAALTSVGVPQNGFPNWAERTDLVLSNRARADPQTELASCASSDCPDHACYSPAPPLVWDYELNLSARLHVTNLVAADSMLQHPSPCLLVSNIASIWPSSCDGSPSCACQGGQSVCNCSTCSCDTTQASCVTQPFTRIQLFNPNGCAENIAAGYTDPQAAVEGWLTEQCSWTGTCGFQTCTTGENGHRYNILDPTNTSMGAGAVVTSSSSACYQGEWDSQDFACGNATIPKLVAGSHFPQTGTQLTFWANWYDTAPPSSAQLDVDGTCSPMTVDRGSGGNATYTWAGTLASGCHSYVFEFTDSTGVSYEVPSAGAYQAGDGCTADYVTAAPTACNGVVAGTTGSGGTSGSGTTGSSTGGSTTGGSTSAGASSSGAGTSSGGATGTVSSSGSGTSSGAAASSSSAGSAAGGSTGPLVGPKPTPVASSGCGCTSGTRADASWALLGLACLALRRRRLQQPDLHA
ncbi:MAG TPA: CAP domain-containing protein [Myxococcales bacterium]|nr:CAP domain-containing protein [Myxococcales bacterium]